MWSKILPSVVAIGEIPHLVDNVAPLLYHPRITSSKGQER
jgi:hypothetical protein